MQQTMIRLIWWAALLAGATFMLPVLIGWEGPAIVAWKGAGVTLLALWAALQVRDANPEGEGWLIALVLACGALGDVLLDAVGLTTGAAAFALGHVLAIILYARNRRARLSVSQALLGWLIAPLGVIIAYALVFDQPDGVMAMIYATLVGSMAAFAWTSRFPRYRTGVGAVMFLVSDLVIFAGQTVWAGTILPKLLIWPLYFAGQALIAWGVVKTLQAADRG